MRLPAKGLTRTEIDQQLQQEATKDVDWKNGKLWTLVYYAGDDVAEILGETFKSYLYTNGLGPTAFKSLKRFEAEVMASAPGAYRAEVTAHLGDTPLGTDVLHFRREDGVAEDFRPEQNRELLEKLAEQTGGQYWTLDSVSGLAQEIRFSEAGIRAREVLDLWDMPLFFFLLIALKASEWLLRRRWGVV